jgi:hypothetical protein
MDEKLDLLKYFPVPSVTPGESPLRAQTSFTAGASNEPSDSTHPVPYIYNYDDVLWAASRSGREILGGLWPTRNSGICKIVLSISSLPELEVLSNPEMASELLDEVDGIHLGADLCNSSFEQCINAHQQLLISHPGLIWLPPCQSAGSTSKGFPTTSDLITRIWAPHSVSERPPPAPADVPLARSGLSTREFIRTNAPTPSAEIAFLLSLGISKVQQCGAAGWDEATPLPVCFEISTTPDIFTQVAKLRALRILWQLIIKELGLGSIHVPTDIVAYCSNRPEQVEPHKALLASICQSIGAIMGGASYVVIQGNDTSSLDATIRSMRMARNIQLIARYESKIGDIIDPVGGSWYAEELTSTLMTSAWEIFQCSQRSHTP